MSSISLCTEIVGAHGRGNRISINSANNLHKWESSALLFNDTHKISDMVKYTPEKSWFDTTRNIFIIQRVADNTVHTTVCIAVYHVISTQLLPCDVIQHLFIVAYLHNVLSNPHFSMKWLQIFGQCPHRGFIQAVQFLCWYIKK